MKKALKIEVSMTNPIGLMKSIQELYPRVKFEIALGKVFMLIPEDHPCAPLMILLQHGGHIIGESEEVKIN